MLERGQGDGEGLSTLPKQFLPGPGLEAAGEYLWTQTVSQAVAAALNRIDVHYFGRICPLQLVCVCFLAT